MLYNRRLISPLRCTPMRCLLALILSFAGYGASIAGDRVVTVRGDDIPIEVFPAAGERLVVWLPSEFGSTPRRRALAGRIAAEGVEVWSPDLHSAWFLPVGRYSLNAIDPGAIGQLLGEVVGSTGKQVFLMAEGRTVALALNAVREWQLTTPDTHGMAGLLAFSPRLFVRTPQGGEAADYLPIASASNLPIYILQPEDASGFWRIADDVRQLEKGGSSVFLHRLPKVSDGFYARTEFSQAEAAMTRRLPGILLEAMRQLAAYGGTPPAPAPLQGEPRMPETPVGSSLLRPYRLERTAPKLRLPTLRGPTVDLAELRSKVVLVNFWATWCPPCVEEIPSLQRLYQRLQGQGLEILAVDVGESEETMEAFLKDKPVGFPILMDESGEALRRWGVYAFPTTLIIDRVQRIRYAVFGAFDWSSQEVVETLQPLLEARGGNRLGRPGIN